MLCDHCHKNEATVHIQEIAGSDQKTFHFCAQCAAKQKLDNEAPQSLQLAALVYNLASQKLDQLSDLALSQEDPEGSSQSPASTCPQCGFTDVDFHKLNRLGCAHCYRHFATQLQPMLDQLQRGATHIGKLPGTRADAPLFSTPDPELDALEADLARSIAAENYERAAELRDLINHRKQ
jgi:protein arginine kinase activator